MLVLRPREVGLGQDDVEGQRRPGVELAASRLGERGCALDALTRSLDAGIGQVQDADRAGALGLELALRVGKAREEDRMLGSSLRRARASHGELRERPFEPHTHLPRRDRHESGEHEDARARRAHVACRVGGKGREARQRRIVGARLCCPALRLDARELRWRRRRWQRPRARAISPIELGGDLQLLVC